MQNDQRRILMLGDVDSREMEPVRTSVARFADGAEIRRAGDWSAAAALVTDENWFPDLVVVCQRWPDEFAPQSVRSLLGLLPLARIVCCCGAWCESDGRNRDCWPPATRVFARTAAARTRRELAVLRGHERPLPLTASRDEIFEFDFPGDLSPAGANRPVHIVSPDVELRRWLGDLLTAAGYRIVTTNQAHGWPSVGFIATDGPREQPGMGVVCDADPWTMDLGRSLEAFRAAHPNAAVVALMNFAHPEDVAAVRACGADAVVAKLAPESELLDALSEAFARNA